MVLLFVMYLPAVGRLCISHCCKKNQNPDSYRDKAANKKACLTDRQALRSSSRLSAAE